MAIHPEGQYKAEVTDHGFSKGNKGPQIWMQFATAEGSIYGFFSLSARAAEHTVKKIRAAGFMGDDFADLADGTALRGNLCDIVVDHEIYEGKTRAKVSWVNPVGSGWTPERDHTAAIQARQFNAILKAEEKIESENVGARNHKDETSRYTNDSDLTYGKINDNDDYPF